MMEDLGGNFFVCLPNRAGILVILYMLAILREVFFLVILLHIRYMQIYLS